MQKSVRQLIPDQTVKQSKLQQKSEKLKVQLKKRCTLFESTQFDKIKHRKTRIRIMLALLLHFFFFIWFEISRGFFLFIFN